MLVWQDKKYNGNFPETYDWNKIDSRQALKMASEIKRWIQHDLESNERNLVPGLRKALNIIAESYTLF